MSNLSEIFKMTIMATRFLNKISLTVHLHLIKATLIDNYRPNVCLFLVMLLFCVLEIQYMKHR